MHVLDKDSLLIKQREDCLVEQFIEPHGRTGQGRDDTVHAPLRNTEAGRKDMCRIEDIIGDNEYISSENGHPKIFVKGGVLFKTDKEGLGTFPAKYFPGHRAAS